MVKKMTLSEVGRYNYSPMEKRLFALLSDKKTTSIEMSSKLFGDDSLFGRNNVVSRMTMLKKKIIQNGEPFWIADSGARGPKPKEYWLEKAK